MVRHKLGDGRPVPGRARRRRRGFTRLPTGFLPEEDQGYAIIGMQLPSAASLARTEATVEEVEAALKGTPGSRAGSTIGGVSLLDNSTTLVQRAP